MGVIVFAQSGGAESGLAATPRRVEEESLRGFMREYVAKRFAGIDANDRYANAFVDLNGEGREEAIVHLVGRSWCGTGGCPTLILTPEGNSYRLVARISITRPPIRVLDERSGGWRSISVWVQGGGILQGYRARLRFDGKQYPANPTAAPAERMTTAEPGEDLIQPASQQKGLDP